MRPTRLAYFFFLIRGKSLKQTAESRWGSSLETSHWFMDDDKHVTIKVPRGEELKDIGIKQFYFYRRVDSKEEKLGALYGTLLDALEPVARTVVFANTKRGVRTHLMQYISRVQQQRRCSGTGIVLDRRSHLPSLTILIW
jgi:hypothetical protein